VKRRVEGKIGDYGGRGGCMEGKTGEYRRSGNCRGILENIGKEKSGGQNWRM
jgi:hypothetical protein